MQLTYFFEVVSDACATIEVDEDELEKPWDEMTDEEKYAVVLDHEIEASNRASRDTDYALGALNFAEDEDGKELYSAFS